MNNFWKLFTEEAYECCTGLKIYSWEEKLKI